MPSIGDCVWELSHPESTYTPAGGRVVEVLEPYVDADTGEVIGRRLICLRVHRGRVETQLLDEAKLSDMVEPFNAAQVRGLARAIWKQLSQTKGAFNPQDLRLEGYGHRLFSLASDGVA